MDDVTDGDRGDTLDPSSVDADPFVQFDRWFADATAAVPSMPEAVALSTATPTGRPSSRMVLLKAWDHRGFVVYTNLDSRKGRELRQNPWAALLFYWGPLGRQIRVEGSVHAVDGAESDAYFASRPRGSRLGAVASRQSRPIADRAALEAAVAQVAAQYPGDTPVPRPENWGGVRVVPDRFEFWQQRPDRLHDRVEYRWSGDRWAVGRLQP